MSLEERLTDLASAIALATTHAPDEYPSWSSWTYATHMADIKALWNEVRPRLQRDIDQAQTIDAKLQEMFALFEAGQKEAGRDIAWALYNEKVEKLR